jgi:nicotinate-nucleotide adenylyltransferase
MNIGLFGGTFDPIHLGHTALARAAMERFALGRIYFVPAGIPPHKRAQPTDYMHRYAMVVLATVGAKAFVPSLLEAPETAMPHVGSKKGQSSQIAAANYTIDTVKRLQSSLKKADRLHFLIGIDAFNDIAKWHEAESLLRSCEFIVASRPGYSLADIANALPESLRPKAEVTKPFSKQPARGDLVLPGVAIHLLENVQQNVSATAIRGAVSAKRALTKLLDPAVAEYIRKMDLYRAH